MLKLCLSRRERARTEETEAAHPAVPATGPREAREVLPDPVWVFDFFDISISHLRKKPPAVAGS